MKAAARGLAISLAMLIAILVHAWQGVPGEPLSSGAGKMLTPEKTIKTYNSRGKEIEMVFSRVPERVVTVENNHIEAMLALGQADRLVCVDINPSSQNARDLSARYPEEYQKLRNLRPYAINLENVLFEQPDCILGWRSSFSPGALRGTEWWQARGVKTYITATSNRTVPYGSMEDEIQYIRDMGQIFDRKAEAERLVAEIMAYAAGLQTALKGRAPVRTLVIESSGPQIINYDTHWLVADLVQRAGGEMISDARLLGAEDLLLLNPEVIFVVYFDDSTRRFADTLQRDPRFNSLRAVQAGRIYPIPLNRMYTTGFSTRQGLEIIARGLHPDLF